MISLIHLLPTLFAKAGASCDQIKGGDFFGFPKWYAYLSGVTDDKGVCSIPTIDSINDVWLILAAIIEILVRLAAILAVVFVIYAAVSYVVSQGEADKTAKAKNTLVNALVGLSVSVAAATIIAFIADKATS